MVEDNITYTSLDYSPAYKLADPSNIMAEKLLSLKVTASTKPRHHHLSYWAVEIASCVGAVVALAAIWIFLSYYNHKPKPDWPYGITINTTVSVFNLVLKALMLLAISEGTCKD